jgi:DNA-binding Lrp family transcriptional regulator
MDDLDRTIVNRLQGGFPISERPFADAAARIGVDEDTLIARVDALIRAGVLSRFGPMYNAELLGGAVALAAMRVPQGRFDAVAALVNAHPEVAHNYARDHALNMWFVVATERPERVAEVIAAIESETGLEVYSMPKIEEFFIGLRLEA